MAKASSSAAELREQVSAWGGPSEGTVVRFEYTYDEKNRRYENGKKIKRNYYSYVAIFVADKWYVTGITDGVRRIQSSAEFYALLASDKVKSADVATAFEGFKP